jgi:ABC-type multidrug transport system fused ATPase/permease subunit
MRALPVSDPGTPDIRSPWHYLAWLVRQQRAGVTLGVFWGCIWMLSQALLPAVIGAAIDALIQRHTSSFSLDCAIVLGLGLLTAVGGVLRHRCVVGNFLDASYRTVQLVTDQVSRLGETMTRLVTTGEIVSIAAADLDAVGGAIDISGRGSGAIASMIAVAAIVLSRSVVLGLIVLIGAPAMTALAGLLLRPLHRRQAAYREQQGDLAARAADIVSGLRVLRGIGGEAAFTDRYRADSQRLRRTGVEVARTESYLAGAEILMPGLFVTLATWIAAHYALNRSITPGDLVMFYGYAAFLVLPMATLTEAADAIVRGGVAAGRVTRVLGLKPDVPGPVCPRPEPHAGASLHDARSGITVLAGELLGIAADSSDEAAALADRLGRYGGASRPGLSGPGLSGPGLRGPGLSGPGLSAPGPDGPGPELGGVPLADLPVDVVRSRILIAPPGAHLFGGPLLESLGDAAPGGSDETAVLQSLRAASAQDVLESLPGGLGGRLAARGTSLSGGQAQRLRLARALLADPEILVLVEPTSAVDAHTEARIARTLRDYRAGRTTVVLTTSPLLLDAVDRVIYLRDGRMAGQGRHHELLAASADYADVVTRGEDL